MSRRIEIELTSARPDGTWTWRAAGAREPKGVLDGGLLPSGAATGAVLKAEAEFELDGITILSVSSGKGRADKAGLLELIASDKPFEAVTQQLAKRERSDRGDRGDRRDRGPRRDDRGPRGPRPEGGDRPRRDRPEGGERGPRGPRPEGGDRNRNERRQRPSFTAPPELPQRPKAKRLKPGKAHRTAILAELPESQRPVAERALQGGLQAVRQAVAEQNTKLKAEGKDEIPAQGLVAMAEQLLPKLRVAEWLDRADAALADIDELDLRDLRSVVASSEDPMVVRDESTRAVAAQLKEALAAKQEKELSLWFGDIDALVGFGRIVRALKLSSQPPKAGIRFPAELAGKLAAATNANLTADALPDRWVAVMEAAAFSPIRTQVAPDAMPTQVNDELTATVKRLAPLLPDVAKLFGVEVAPGAHAPKPLRPTRPAAPKKPAAKPAAPSTAAAKAAVPAETEPVLPADAAIEAESPADSEPAVEVEPVAAAEPAVEAEPEAATEPAVEAEPVAAPESAADVAPEVDAEPAGDAEPVVDAAVEVEEAAE